MAITAGQVNTTSTLEQFRVEFNKLQTDVSGIEAGSLSFTNVSATTISVAELTVTSTFSADTIIFEGSTDDDNETSLTVVDPTADRTITLPNETGTVITTGTTANTLITGQTSITSGDIVSGSDELIISDASASTFKRVTVDNLISSAGGLTSVAADSSPQLGANLDTNSFNILIDDAHFIGDENGNEQIIFQTTSSAVNQIDITNAASGSGPSIASTGDDSNINLTLTPKGTGKVIIDGNGSSGGVSIDDGVIDIRTGTGNEAKILFYCESSNAHAQTLQAAPHSAASSATIVLPTASGTLIGTGDTGTLPLAAVDIDGGTDIGADLTQSDLIMVDDGAGGTNRKAALSRVVTLVSANIDDPTALSIALG